jgi:predicted nucleotide-binding protein
VQEAIGHFNNAMALPLIKEMFAFNKNRARQNVVMELGYFIGKLGRSKVCCLYKGDIELPSDMQGICYLHFKNSVDEVKDTIIEELKAAKIISC